MVATDKQQASPLWTTTTSEVRLTGTWREAKPDYHVAPSPCHGACPVQGDIASWIQSTATGRDGWHMQFGALCGRYGIDPKLGFASHQTR